LSSGNKTDSYDIINAQKTGTKIMQLIRAYMFHGHYMADVDPLELNKAYAEVGSDWHKTNIDYNAFLNYESYGYSDAALDKKLYIDLPDYGGLLDKKKEWTLRELLEALKNAYCGKIGVEFMHIPDRDICTWIRNKFELRQFNPLTCRERELILKRILETDEFNNFIGTKFNTMKRFGIEGCDALIPGLKIAITTLKDLGCEKTTFGMPHRGRLALLANVVKKPLEIIFSEF
jgi:2-oxoglutarate dehydrogenase E1 component